MATVGFNLISKSGLPLATGPLKIGVPSNTIAEIAQNVRMILTTNIGTQVLERSFGSDWSFIDKPQNQAIAIIQASVLNAIHRWEPRAVVASVKYLGQNAIGGEIDVNVVLDFILPSIQQQNTPISLPIAAPAQVLDFNPDGSISVQTESIIQ
jgi:phage baseplate assembly protein W